MKNWTFSSRWLGARLVVSATLANTVQLFGNRALTDKWDLPAKILRRSQDFRILTIRWVRSKRTSRASSTSIYSP